MNLVAWLLRKLNTLRVLGIGMCCACIHLNANSFNENVDQLNKLINSSSSLRQQDSSDKDNERKDFNDGGLEDEEPIIRNDKKFFIDSIDKLGNNDDEDNDIDEDLKLAKMQQVDGFKGFSRYESRDDEEDHEAYENVIKNSKIEEAIKQLKSQNSLSKTPAVVEASPQPVVEISSKIEAKEEAKKPLINEEQSIHQFWPQSRTSHFAYGSSLPNLIRDFCNMQDINVVLSDKLLQNSTKVNRRFVNDFPVNIWNQLAKSYGFIWFFDSNILYVYDNSECETKTLQVPPERIKPLLNIVDQLGFYSSRYSLKSLPEGGIVIASGPPKFINLIEDMSNNVRYYKPVKQDDVIDIQIFSLKHAWAIDKVIGNASVPGVATLLKDILGNNQRTNTEGKNLPIDTTIAHKVQSVGKLAIDKEEDPKNEEVSEKSQQQKDLLPQTGLITTDSRQNAIIVKDYTRNMPMYERLIEQLDVPLELIEIQAAIVNVDRSFGIKMGLNKFKFGKFEIHPLSSQSSAESQDWTSSLTGIVNGSEFMSTIVASEGISNNRILARPSVITMDNITAVMTRSETVYMPVSGAKTADLYSVSGSTTLNVTPHIIQDIKGRVQIQLLLDIKDEKLIPGAEKEKNVNSSSILTQAVVYEGQSVLVGGYFNENSRHTEDGVPFLKEIPVIGHVFKHKYKNETVAERLFLITPKIIKLSSRDNTYADYFKEMHADDLAEDEEDGWYKL